MTAAGGLLGGHAHFLHWGIVQISLANLIVIALMLIVFVLALVVAFPHGHEDTEPTETNPQDAPDVHR